MTVLSECRNQYHAALRDEILHFVTTEKNGRNARNADASNKASRTVANHLAGQLGAIDGGKMAGQTVGNKFEQLTADYLNSVFSNLDHL